MEHRPACIGAIPFLSGSSNQVRKASLHSAELSYPEPKEKDGYGNAH